MNIKELKEMIEHLPDEMIVTKEHFDGRYVYLGTIHSGMVGKRHRKIRYSLKSIQEFSRVKHDDTVYQDCFILRSI